MPKTIEQIKTEWSLTEEEAARLVTLGAEILFDPDYILAHNAVVQEITDAIAAMRVRVKDLENVRQYERCISAVRKFEKAQFIGEMTAASELTARARACGVDLTPLYELQNQVWQAPDEVMQRSGWSDRLNSSKSANHGFEKYQPKQATPNKENHNAS